MLVFRLHRLQRRAGVVLPEPVGRRRIIIRAGAGEAAHSSSAIADMPISSSDWHARAVIEHAQRLFAEERPQRRDAVDRYPLRPSSGGAVLREHSAMSMPATIFRRTHGPAPAGPSLLQQAVGDGG